mmetsp:Transcript_9897/g.20123  ORF Transcript_9897/g.20123 Transcript_9897/m.20123 type:complete len:111 (+) Transcript_9897:394-726(+)
MFVLGHTRPSTGQHFIYRNMGRGTFSCLSGTGVENVWSQTGFLLKDFDGDGYLHIFVFGPGVTSLRGMPNCKFTDVTATASDRKCGSPVQRRLCFRYGQPGICINPLVSD